MEIAGPVIFIVALIAALAVMAHEFTVKHGYM